MDIKQQIYKTMYENQVSQIKEALKTDDINVVQGTHWDKVGYSNGHLFRFISDHHGCLTQEALYVRQEMKEPDEVSRIVTKHDIPTSFEEVVKQDAFDRCIEARLELDKMFS